MELTAHRSALLSRPVSVTGTVLYLFRNSYCYSLVGVYFSMEREKKEEKH